MASYQASLVNVDLRVVVMILAASISLLFYARDVFDRDRAISRSASRASTESLLVLLVIRYMAASENLVFVSTPVMIMSFGLVMLVRCAEALLVNVADELYRVAF
jgi:hypothetical protein